MARRCQDRDPGSTAVNRRHIVLSSGPPILGPWPGGRPTSSIAAARVRARTAKVVLGGTTALVFGVAFVGAKAHAPGHAKHKARPLGAPQSFELAVRQSAFAAGQIAPPVQPPSVVTSTS
jgi:hypothetical protein